MGFRRVERERREPGWVRSWVWSSGGGGMGRSCWESRGPLSGWFLGREGEFGLIRGSRRRGGGSNSQRLGHPLGREVLFLRICASLIVSKLEIWT